MSTEVVEESVLAIDHESALAIEQEVETAEAVEAVEPCVPEKAASVAPSRPPVRGWLQVLSADASVMGSGGASRSELPEEGVRRHFCLDFETETLSCAEEADAEGEQQLLRLNFGDLQVVAPMRAGARVAQEAGCDGPTVEEDICCMDMEELSRTIDGSVAAESAEALPVVEEAPIGLILRVRGQAPLELVGSAPDEATRWIEALREALAVAKLAEAAEPSTAAGSKVSSRRNSPSPLPALGAAEAADVEEEVVAIGSSTSHWAGSKPANNSAWGGGAASAQSNPTTRYADKGEGLTINERLSQLVFSDDEDEDGPPARQGQNGGESARGDLSEQHGGDNAQDGSAARTDEAVTVEACEAFVQESNEDGDSDEETAEEC
eukprot:TRINITY_DN54026_c0_g1_i1.p1 TRINITY_DN54026_c0_g1~~TRINITY_DN54026_c0_g1_i1.p1  ORF type:complete len:379 (-),score=116.78 TRINITY_DN54026_c0_g1_i1:75-1211(-)